MAAAVMQLPMPRLEERGLPSLTTLGSARSHQSLGARSVTSLRSAAASRFSERSMAAGLAGVKCAHCQAMGINICSACSMKRKSTDRRPSLNSQSGQRKSKIQLQEDSPVAVEMLRCLRESKVDHEEIRELLRGTTSAVNAVEGSFGWSPILFAAHSGDVKLSSLLLEAKANMHAKCNQGNSVIHLAARRGNLDVATLLHSRGADINELNVQGWSPLTWSAIAGYSSIASFLLDLQADASQRDGGGRTACMWAARHGHTDILSNLLTMGADLTLRDEDGLSIKDHARHYAEMQKTISNNVTMSSLDLDTESLYWATDQGSLDLQRLLMQFGANRSNETEGGPQAPLLAVKGAMMRTEQLLEAARSNNWEAAEEALRAGACASTRGKADLMCPLGWAAIHNAPAIAFSLVAAMAGLEVRDALGWTALHHAVQSESAQMVSVLHYLGADFSAKSEDGDSAQHLAALSDAGEMLQLLGPTTSDWDIRNAAGHTPLQVAATRGCLSAVCALLALKADVNVQDEHGQSVLALAAAQGHVAVVQALVEPIDPLPRVWEEDELNSILEQLPWVDSDVVDNDGPGSRGNNGSSSGSVCSGSGVSCGSSVSGRNDKLGTKLAGQLLQRQKQGGMQTIKEVDSENPSPQITPKADRPKSAGSHASQKSTALTQVSSHSKAASVASRAPSQASVQSLARSAHSHVSLARSGYSQGSKAHSRASGATGMSRASLGGKSRGSAGGRSRAGRPTGPPTIYSMAISEIERSPVSLMNASCKVCLDSQLPPALAISTALKATDADGSAALAMAARARQSDMVRLLLDLKASPDTPDLQRNTPLMVATSVGDKDIVLSLMGAKASVDAQNASGLQAVDLAPSDEIEEILQAEMDRNAVKMRLKKSVSLPALVKAPSRTTVNTKKPSGCRIRLDCLPSWAPAEQLLLEAEVWETLKLCRVASPVAVDVAVDPITLRTHGHVFLDYASAEQAEAAATRLSATVDEDEMRVSIDGRFL